MLIRCVLYNRQMKNNRREKVNYSFPGVSIFVIHPRADILSSLKFGRG